MEYNVVKNKIQKVPSWWAYKLLTKSIIIIEKLRAKVNPAPLKVSEAASGHFKTQVLRAGIELNIFESLQEKINIDKLSETTKIKKEYLYRLLRVLIAYGFVKKNNDEYIIDDMGKCLLKGNKKNMIAQVMMISGDWYSGFMNLTKALSKGDKVLDDRIGRDYFQYLDGNKETAEIFNQSMIGLSNSVIPAILAEYDFSEAKHIVDIGGGYGHLLLSILNNYPHIKGTVFDTAKTVFQDVSAEKVNIIPGNFLESIPSVGDFYILKWILHDWDDEKALTILINCRNAMKAGDKLLIIEFLIGDDEKSGMRLYLDMLLLTMFNGKERTIRQIQKLVNDAGLKYIRTIATRSLVYLIEVEK
jgi:predicted transcriptional regulator